jgi:hypothetical protein
LVSFIWVNAANASTIQSSFILDLEMVGGLLLWPGSPPGLVCSWLTEAL